MLLDPLGEISGDENAVQTIRIFTSHESADIAAANLRAHDIECWTMSDDAGGILPNLTAPAGVRLIVNKADAGEALELLTPEE